MYRKSIEEMVGKYLLYVFPHGDILGMGPVFFFVKALIISNRLCYVSGILHRELWTGLGYMDTDIHILLIWVVTRTHMKQ